MGHHAFAAVSIGGPAAHQGTVHVGDTLVSVNGKDVRSIAPGQSRTLCVALWMCVCVCVCVCMCVFCTHEGSRKGMQKMTTQEGRVEKRGRKELPARRGSAEFFEALLRLLPCNTRPTFQFTVSQIGFIIS